MPENRSFKKPSIRDVAKLASVSVTTVSHVVSETPGYSEETVRRVKEAIKTLNYVPSYVAKGLRQKSTRTIGVCARDPFEHGGGDMYSYPDRLWAGILAEADQNQYKVMHFPKSVRESEDAGEFLNGQIDGLIICASRHDQRPALAARAGLPVVMVARYFDLPEGVGAVAADEESIVRCGLRHLFALGHRRIAFVAGPASEQHPEFPVQNEVDDVADSRLRSYRHWMAEHCPEEQLRWVTTPNWEGADLDAPVKRWVDEGVTAVFGANDTLARHVLDVARLSKVKVPNDLSVLGIDNDLTCNITYPPLSSIDVPIQQIGRLAVRSLLQTMQGAPAARHHLDLSDLEVIVRSSTGPRPHRI